MSRDRQGRAGAARHPLPRHRARWRRRATVAAVPFLMLLASPASADPCSLTDPECLTDSVEETVDTIEKAVGSAEETVNEAAEDVAETVDETSTEVVGEVGKVIDGLLGKEKENDPGGGGGGHDAPGAGRRRARDGRGETGFLTPRLEPRDPALDPLFRTPAAVPGVGVRAPSAGGGARGTIGTVARQLAFPAILAAMVLAFLAIQNRLDRRDPRLASAPLGPEFLMFE